MQKFRRRLKPEAVLRASASLKRCPDTNALIRITDGDGRSDAGNDTKPMRRGTASCIGVQYIGARTPGINIFSEVRKPLEWPRSKRTFLGQNLVDLDDSIADSVESEIRDGVQIEFPHQVGAVGFGGFDA